MYIVVHHRVVDRQRFLATDPNDIGGNAPAGVDVFHFLPARDASAADCLWEAPSLAALREYLDPATRGICENAYFEVDAKLAKGLPATTGRHTRDFETASEVARLVGLRTRHPRSV